MLLELVYLLALSPWLLWHAFRTGRYRQNFASKTWSDNQSRGDTRSVPVR